MKTIIETSNSGEILPPSLLTTLALSCRTLSNGNTQKILVNRTLRDSDRSNVGHTVSAWWAAAPLETTNREQEGF
ncbi:hypothetical protein [Spirulina major]|uniref:hypothetical protein n=1 Tax=Spirulina major TaxID=270636 RepID=UPI0011150061|nr:hypothetical protein [Spirulina major]